MLSIVLVSSGPYCFNVSIVSFLSCKALFRSSFVIFMMSFIMVCSLFVVRITVCYMPLLYWYSVSSSCLVLLTVCPSPGFSAGIWTARLLSYCWECVLHNVDAVSLALVTEVISPFWIWWTKFVAYVGALSVLLAVIQNARRLFLATSFFFRWVW